MFLSILDCDKNGKLYNDRCVCNEGFAGNGIICGIDSDLGNTFQQPDLKLELIESKRRKLCLMLAI